MTAEPATDTATLDLVLKAVAGGVRVVQLRDKTCTTKRRISLLRRLRADLPPEVTVIVNDDVEAAAAVPGSAYTSGPMMITRPGSVSGSVAT